MNNKFIIQRQVMSVIAASLLLLCSSAQGEDSALPTNSVFDLNLSELLNIRVVVAASGFEQPLEDAPASVTVIEAEEWQAIGATTLFQAIDRVLGLHVSLVQTGLIYEKPILRGLSGAFGQQVLLLVDGMPFRSGRDGGAPWAQHLPLLGVKRIEIVRGSGSAIYGADAVGGIINLVSYAPGEVQSQVNIGVGESGTYGFELAKNLQWRQHKLQFMWSSRSFDGDSRRLVDSDFQSQLDTEFGTQASLAPGPMVNDYESHTLKLAWSSGNVRVAYLDWYAPRIGNGAGAAQSLDPEGKMTMRAKQLQVNYDLSARVSGVMNLEFTWHDAHLKAHANLFPAGSILFLDEHGNIRFPSATISIDELNLVSFPDGVIGIPEHMDRALSLQLNHVFDLNESHKVRWAIGLERNTNSARESKNFGPGVYDGNSAVVDGRLTNVTGTEYIYLPNSDRDNQFVALQDNWAFADNWNATLGVRYDNYSDFGSTTNPRLGLVWHAHENISIKAFAGSAFRAPSFLDLYAKNNPAGEGNPNLKSESVGMFDVGMAATYSLTKALQLETTVFRYAADNLIRFVPVGNVQRAENSGTLKVRGVEQQLNWQVNRRVSIDFNLTLLDPYHAYGVDNSSVPKTMANLSFHYHRDRWHGYLGAKWVAERERNQTDERKTPIADYLSVDLNLQYKCKAWRAGFLVENLIDEDIREPSNGLVLDDYPMPGRLMSLFLSRSL